MGGRARCDYRGRAPCRATRDAAAQEMSAYVLDTGALIALERNDRAMWARLLVAASSKARVVVPSTALAQAWRGGRSQARLARALSHCEIAPFDPLAREVGELCGRSGSTDLCDAHVALVASRLGDWLCTSDIDDMGPLLIACSGRHRPVLIRC
jgi:hypothetical protein